METNVASPRFANSPVRQSILFAIDLNFPHPVEEDAREGGHRYSIFVRIESEEVLFVSNAIEVERTGTYAQALAEHIAFSAIEKDVPSGVEFSLSAKQIDCIPPELEGRVPNFCMDGNDAWLIEARTSEEELAAAGKLAA
jgi:hypothetical protein